jgi:hypothetical protein
VSQSAVDRAQLEECGAALAEQVGVPQFVDRVLQIEAAQERIGRDFGGAQDVASAVAFHLGERDQLADTAVEIAPHPPVDRAQHPVDVRSLSKRHRGTP